MEKIIRNSSLTEFNNCSNKEEVIDVFAQCKVKGEVEVYETEGGIFVALTPDHNKAFICFSPREKDNTVDIVAIKKSKYISNIPVAVSQFFTQYGIQNPFGLKPRTHLPMISFLKGIASYMAVVANTDEEIEETVEYCKQFYNQNGTVESIEGESFSYVFKNGFVTIQGSARANFF